MIKSYLNLSNIKPLHKKIILVCVDSVILYFSAYVSFVLRFGDFIELTNVRLILIFSYVVISIPIFIRHGLYRSVIRYIGEQALWEIVKSLVYASIVWSTAAFMMQFYGGEGLPRSIPIICLLLSVFLIAGLRFLIRWIFWVPLSSHYSLGQVLIYGAGSSGRQLAYSLRFSSTLFPAGFLDDDKSLTGRDIDGVRVYSPDDIKFLKTKFNIKEVIISIQSISMKRRKEIIEWIAQNNLKIKILPSLTDFVYEKNIANLIRDADIGDILGRDKVIPDMSLLNQSIKGKNVLVTGAGGSIGSELCRQISILGPEKLIVLDSSEFALFNVLQTINDLGIGLHVQSYLGSTSDENIIKKIFSENKISTIYHAAAYKHVPLLETNLYAAVTNNIFGTLNIIDAAIHNNVDSFVLISSDKAVRPESIMGATKRWCEVILKAYVHTVDDRTLKYCSVRFGNVLGSSGSVVPLFQKQILLGGPVTVTDPRMKRYFMSVHEAVELVIQAGNMADGGEVFLLDMGEPIRIYDLARNMIALSGKKIRDSNNLEGDIEVIFTGIRPAEKIHEELFINPNSVINSKHPKILIAKKNIGNPNEIFNLVEKMRFVVDNEHEEAIRCLLFEPKFLRE